MQNPEWIVFDLGGVLVTHDRVDTYKVLAKLLDIPLEEALKWREPDAEAYMDISIQVMSDDSLHSIFGKRYTKELTKDQVIDFLNGELGHPIYETVEVLKKLKSNYKVACLSNTCSPHWAWLLKNCEFMQLFDVRMASQEMGIAKPDLGIYQKAIQILKTEPSKCLFFDDRSENVEAAIKAGWRAYRVVGPESVREGLVREGVTF